MSAVRIETISPETIDAFLAYLSEKGRGEASLRSYRRILTELYRYLPEDKCIGEETGPAWKAFLERQGLQPATVNNRMSVWNSFLLYLDTGNGSLEILTERRRRRSRSLAARNICVFYRRQSIWVRRSLIC